jgi:hypothetical protein
MKVENFSALPHLHFCYSSIYLREVKRDFFFEFNEFETKTGLVCGEENFEEHRWKKDY